MTHVIEVDVSKDDELSIAVEKLWDLETVGVKDHEAPAYEKCLDKVRFKNGRYEVSLPFKEDHPCIEDNFVLSERRLQKLKAN